MLAFTGDTGWTEDLPTLAKGADLFVCECTDDWDSIDTHLSWELLAPRFSQLEAKKILLTHFSASMRQKLTQLAAARVQFAEDAYDPEAALVTVDVDVAVIAASWRPPPQGANAADAYRSEHRGISGGVQQGAAQGAPRRGRRLGRLQDPWRAADGR